MEKEHQYTGGVKKITIHNNGGYMYYFLNIDKVCFLSQKSTGQPFIGLYTETMYIVYPVMSAGCHINSVCKCVTIEKDCFTDTNFKALSAVFNGSLYSLHLYILDNLCISTIFFGMTLYFHYYDFLCKFYIFLSWHQHKLLQ